eukprot:TRINITY_DN15117_c0_g1_i1.p2 TRINITY_DN15117_c0_g1~~TRINITY_DN15117_c0_g1_i1.p2  ORF type:complete len:102 (-),score=8.22 TRINITY_DN15117_c0_g1_i1:444-749(-)
MDRNPKVIISTMDGASRRIEIFPGEKKHSTLLNPRMKFCFVVTFFEPADNLFALLRFVDSQITSALLVKIHLRRDELPGISIHPRENLQSLSNCTSDISMT